MADYYCRERSGTFGYSRYSFEDKLTRRETYSCLFHFWPATKFLKVLILSILTWTMSPGFMQLIPAGVLMA